MFRLYMAIIDLIIELHVSNKATFFRVFLICGWWNPPMRTLRIWRADSIPDEIVSVHGKISFLIRRKMKRRRISLLPKNYFFSLLITSIWLVQLPEENHMTCATPHGLQLSTQGSISMFLKFLAIFKLPFLSLSVSSGISPINYPDLHLFLQPTCFTPQFSFLVKHYGHPTVFTFTHTLFLFFLVSEYGVFPFIHSPLLLGQALQLGLWSMFTSLFRYQILFATPSLFCVSKININVWLKMGNSVKYICFIKYITQYIKFKSSHNFLI